MSWVANNKPIASYGMEELAAGQMCIKPSGGVVRQERRPRREDQGAPV